MLAKECYVKELKGGEREVRVVELLALGERPSPPFPPEIMVHEVKTRDEWTSKLGEVNEPFELIYLDPTHLKDTIRIVTKMESTKWQ